MHVSSNSCAYMTEINLKMKKEGWTWSHWRDSCCPEQGTKQPCQPICYCYPAVTHCFLGFFCCFLYDSGFLHFFMEGNLLGPFSLLNWIILTSSGVICGKASDQTSSLFIYFHFIGVVGAWCPTDSAHCHKQKPGNSLSSFHLAKLVHSPQLSCHVIAVTAGSLRWKSINSMSLYACYWLWASCPLAQSRTTHWLCVDYTK